MAETAAIDHLIAEAHRRGLRVLLDGVFNHVGTDFPRFREASDGGPDHPSARWFRQRRGRFETADPAVGWLNNILAIGVGARENKAVRIAVHEVL